MYNHYFQIIMQVSKIKLINQISSVYKYNSYSICIRYYRIIYSTIQILNPITQFFICYR